MKIHQLPLGARFEFEGEEYVKTGPLFATGKSGGQRLIPKYAQLTVLGDREPATGTKAAALPRRKVLEAFEAFCQDGRQWIPADRQADLEAARRRFLKSLGLEA